LLHVGSTLLPEVVAIGRLFTYLYKLAFFIILSHLFVFKSFTASSFIVLVLTCTMFLPVFVVFYVSLTVCKNCIVDGRVEVWTMGGDTEWPMQVPNRCATGEYVRPTPTLFNAKLVHQMAGLFAEFFRPRNGASLKLIALLLLMSTVEMHPGPAIMLGILDVQ
jgi:hypothetical protein